MTEQSRSIIVTGGAGFIGSALVRRLVAGGVRIISLDKLTYAGNLASLAAIADAPNYRFVHGDIADVELVLSLLCEEAPDGIINLAAESHVDRSIEDPAAFIETNIVGTYRLLQAALAYWRDLSLERRKGFRFHHVSTDEVFGDLPFDRSIFAEETPYAPSSPYSASKAASDHLVGAWCKTYGLPIVLSRCSNNYGPFQWPEKLIPKTILNAISGNQLSIYGEGENVRDWLFVEDHAAVLAQVFFRGRIGDSYNIGSRAERTNLQVVLAICDLLDQRRPLGDGRRYRDLIRFISDRPGHDRRYAMNLAKVERELIWHPTETFESGLAKTVEWYLDNRWWWEPIWSTGA